MVASFETTSHAGQTASTVLLNINPNQNLSLDLDSSRYSNVLKPIIECMHYSPLDQALTMFGFVALVHLSKAFSSTNYNQSEGLITFDVDSHKTSISKVRFYMMLGFSSIDGLIDPESISSSEIIKMFYME